MRNNANPELRCTLPDNELIEKCQEWIKRLCETGGRAWTLQVPVNFNADPDMLFIELVKRYGKLIGNNSHSPSTCAGTWVRAADRLPADGWYGPIRFRYDEKRKAWEYDAEIGRGVQCNLDNYPDVEWLDENPHPGT